MVSKVDVYNLPDDELFNRLKTYNNTVGPVVDSTRNLYRKMLLKYLSSPPPQEEDASDNEAPLISDFVDYRESPVQKSIPETSTPSRVGAFNSSSMNVSQHSKNFPLKKSAEEVFEESIKKGYENLYSDYHPSSYIPTARRSVIRGDSNRHGYSDVQSSPFPYQPTVNYSENGLRSRAKPHTEYDYTISEKSPPKKGICYRCFLYVSLLLIASVVTYCVYLFLLTGTQSSLDSIREAADELLASIVEQPEGSNIDPDFVETTSIDDVLKDLPPVEGA